ncbi:MAG: exodeoxyribonuclease V subunit gamma [Candidatus Binataceae bacterium]|jgi:exodeoxyribonuclease V gamma subunit
MIHLHYSNRLEELIDPFAELAGVDQARSPLERVTVVVPGRAIQEFLKLRLAEREGVAANLDFPFLRGYLKRIAEQAAGGEAAAAVKVLDAGGLQIAVFEYLREALTAPREADLAPVQAYLAAAQDDSGQRAVKLFQLSGRVAWLMREYSTARRAMLVQWPRGATLAAERMGDTETWQRRIYISLFERDGSLRPAWIAPAIDAARWMLLPFAFDAIDDERLRAVLPARLHIFGIGYAGPEFIRIFARLGTLTELHIYTLNPCREFWEDVRERRSARPPRVGSLIESAEDPFGLEAPDESLALRYWGRAGREYIRLLNETTDCDFDSHFIEPAPEDGRATLLSRVQQAILTRTPEQPAAIGDAARSRLRVDNSAPDDGSIAILECPGVRREIEITANAIWSMIRRDADGGGTPLRFHQIAVVLPEAVRDRYMVHVESVFAAAHRIPVNLVDRRLAAQSRVAEAVDLLLRLPLGRFTRDEMIHLLTHPAIAGRDGEPHAQAWPEWCRRLGVRFGADEGAFAETYVEPKIFHWDYALKQLALGLFMAGAPSGETRVFDGGGGREYLPFEISEDEAESVAIMVRQARALIRDAQALAASELSLAAWRRVLTDLIATYVNPADRTDERVRDLIVDAIDSIYTDGIRSEPVPYEVALDLALARIAEVEAEQGTYAESGIVVGSLATLRSLPFRVVFLLGLGEEDFPAREARDPLDLRQALRRAGDVSPAERDRYMFLETLLAARDRIYLSYVARNPHTGEAREPSPVIRDLQFILRGMIGEDAVKRLVIAHPVSAHDRRYFADLTAASDPRDERLETFDRNARRGAQIAALRADLELRCGPVPEAEPDRSLLDRLSDTAREKVAARLHLVAPPAVIASAGGSRVRVSISALKHYLECPLQGAARYALGMREEDDGDDEETGDEPLAQTRLEAALLLRDVLWRARGSRDRIEGRYDETYRLRVLKGSAPVGPFAAAQRADHLGRLELAIIQGAAVGISNLERWQRIALGGVEEFTEVDRAIDPIILDVELVRTDGRRVTAIELRGLIGPVSPQIDKSLKLIARGAANSADFLDGALAAIVLAAAGEKMPAEFLMVVAGGDKDAGAPARYARRMRPPIQAEARDYLKQIAVDLLSDRNDYFLPIEAIEELVKLDDRTDAAIDEAIRTIRDKRPPSCKSDFGPVRNAREFRVPLEELRQNLIARRYGPLMGIFAREKQGKTRASD